MNYFNYKLGLGKWVLDVRDGELMFRRYLMIDDSLPYERFERHLRAVMSEVSEHGPVLQRLAAGSLTAREAFEQEGVVVG
jgi:hypothetical protein